MGGFSGAQLTWLSRAVREGLPFGSLPAGLPGTDGQGCQLASKTDPSPVIPFLIHIGNNMPTDERRWHMARTAGSAEVLEQAKQCSAKVRTVGELHEAQEVVLPPHMVRDEPKFHL